MRTPALVVLCALALGGCASVLLGAGVLLSCGPMPLSPDDCEGGWVRLIFGAHESGPPSPALHPGLTAECVSSGEVHDR